VRKGLRPAFVLVVGVGAPGAAAADVGAFARAVVVLGLLPLLLLLLSVIWRRG